MAFFKNQIKTSSPVISKTGKPQTPATKSSSQDLHVSESLISSLAEITKREAAIDERELLVSQKDSELSKRLAKIARTETQLEEKLAAASHITIQEAKVELLAQVEKSLSDEVAKKIRQAEEQTKANAGSVARDILVDAMLHGATEYTAEYTVSVVRIPDDEAKGRIIGREGRNIRAFEQVTGVEIEMDETNDLRLSSFDSVRREIARLSLEKLIKDSRIQPGRIEEIVKQTQTQMDTILLEEGKRICGFCGVYNLPPDLVKMIGRYKFRFSYGQNLGLHTIEETKIGVAIAQELKGDIDSVRLGCLLHDIGKVVTEEEGTHVQLGVEVLKKFGLPEIVINAVAEHHEDKPFSSIVSRIVWVADAISGSRPGARYEPHGEYVKRMGQIEEIAKSYSGVETAYAFQAGRDVRVLVKPEEISDSELTVLVHKIAQHLERDTQYAGQIKVTGIRELRISEVTKAK